MVLAYYTDEHVPKAIVVALRMRGIDVLTVVEDGHKCKPDEVLLERAHSLGRVMVTQDRDFLKIVHVCYQEGRPFSGVVYAPQQGPSIGVYIESLYWMAAVYDPPDMENQLQFLPL